MEVQNEKLKIFKFLTNEKIGGDLSNFYSTRKFATY